MTKSPEISVETARMERAADAGLRRFVWLLSIGWTVVALASSGWGWRDARQDAVKMGLVRAHSQFQKEAVAHSYLAERPRAPSLGGVRQPGGDLEEEGRSTETMSQGAKASPKAAKPQIAAAAPAYMDDLLRNLLADSYGLSSHLTSLKPLDLRNDPDPWDREALKLLETGLAEVKEVIRIDGAPYLKVMRPLYVKKACLTCHGSQGYSVGDVRGGIVVTFPMASAWEQVWPELRATLIGHLVLWIVGLVAIGWGGRRFARGAREYRRAQEELHRSEHRFASLFQNMFNAIVYQRVVYDDSGRPCDAVVLAVNEAFERDTGISRSEIVGRPISKIMEKLVFPDTDWRPGFRRCVDGGEILRFEHWIEPLGRCFALSVFTPAEGYLAVLGEDVTELRRSQEERLRLQEQLRKSQKLEALGKLAGGIAHDFNNLLTVLFGMTTLIRSRLKRPEIPVADIEEKLDDIEEASAHAAALTRQLLTFSRRGQVNLELFEPNPIVRGLRKLVARMVGDKIDLAISLGKDVGKIRADVGQLEQVVLNLAINARDAMPGGGKLEISTESVAISSQTALLWQVKPGRFMQLTVTDTGTGMSPEILERIYEPFFTTKKNGQGTGLGLATVYGIVRGASGHIEVESQPGVGTTFRVCFPEVSPSADEA